MLDVDACCRSFPLNPPTLTSREAIIGVLSCRPHRKSRPQTHSKLPSAQRAAAHKALTPGVFPPDQARSCDFFRVFFFFAETDTKKTMMGAGGAGVSSPYKGESYLWNCGRLFIKTKLPPVFIRSDHGCSWGGCQGPLWQPWFLSDQCKTTKGRAESKESKLVDVAHTQLNNKCQMLLICSHSHADELTFHFWNAFTQYH